MIMLDSRVRITWDKTEILFGRIPDYIWPNITWITCTQYNKSLGPSNRRKAIVRLSYVLSSGEVKWNGLGKIF